MVMPDGVAGEFDQRAKSYRRSSLWVDDPNVLSAALGVLGNGSERFARVLDLGGGTGALVSFLMEAGVVSEGWVLDASREMLRQCDDSVHKVHRELDVGFDDLGVFDAVLARQVLHYLADPRDSLKDLRSALSPGGVFYVGQIVAPSLVSRDYLFEVARLMSPNRLRVYVADEVVGLAEDLGLKVARIEVVPFVDHLRRWAGRTPSGRGVNPPSAPPKVVRDLSLLDDCMTLEWVHLRAVWR